MKYNKLIILLFMVIGFVSCDTYLDVNDDPNNPTADLVTPDLILPAAINGTCSAKNQAFGGTMTYFGNVMMNQWAGDVTNFTSGNSDEYTFNMTNTFYQNIWNNMYLVTDKLQAIINKDSEEYTYFTAIAQILKAHNMQYVVDAYGDAPYTEAFQRGANYQPAYDDDFAIYQSLYDLLSDSISKIDNAGISAINPSGSDVMLGGNMAMWKKLANTIKLRLLVRASSSTDATVQAWVTDKFNELSGASFLGAGENVNSNPGYVNDANKQNPFYASFFTTDGNLTQNNKFVVGSEYFIEYLKGTYGTPNDSRISAYFTNPPYQGIQQGATDPANPNQPLSFVGPGLLRGADQDVWFFTAAESLLLQSEAVMKGYLPGNAEALFNSAVTESFNLLGLGAGASTYVAAINGQAGIGWTGNQADDIQAIMTQKWIALHSIDPIQSYFEHSRTGYPNPPLPTLATDSHRPYRLMYPLSEFVGNSANVPNLTRADLFVPSIFWQQ